MDAASEERDDDRRVWNEEDDDSNDHDTNDDSYDDDDDSALRSSLCDVERMLDDDRPSVASASPSASSLGGRPRRSSLGDALRDLRRRLGATRAHPLAERLRVAEIAHATRAPLRRLRSELAARTGGDQHRASASSSTSTSRPPLKRGRSEISARRVAKHDADADTDDADDAADTHTTSMEDASVGERGDRRRRRRNGARNSHDERTKRSNKDDVDNDDEEEKNDLFRRLRIEPSTDDGTTIRSDRAATEFDHVFSEMDIEVVLTSDDQTNKRRRPETNVLLSSDSSSRLSDVHRSVLLSRQGSFSDLSTASSVDGCLPPGRAPPVYSWGTAGVSLYDDDDEKDRDPLAEPVGPSHRVGRAHVVAVALSRTHSLVATQTGTVLACGDDARGAVGAVHERGGHVLRPTPLESIAVPVASVSCGPHHSAAVTVDGTALTWGDDAHGQLGHGRGLVFANDRDRVVPSPRAAALGRRRARSVACGDGFTLILTSRMQVLACGVDVVAGHPATGRDRPTLVPALLALPVVRVAAGRRHAIVLTCHGTAYVWGDNDQGQCGRQFPNELSSPVPLLRTQHYQATTTTTTERNKLLTGVANDRKLIRAPPKKRSSTKHDRRLDALTTTANATASISPPLPTNDDEIIVHAACGDDHTVLVVKSGRLVVCGDNAEGQLGLPRTTTTTAATTELVDGRGRRWFGTISHPEPGGRFVEAAAGRAHTLALDEDGDVWSLEGGDGPTPILRGRSVVLVAAGGDRSAAVCEAPRESVFASLTSPPSTTPPDPAALSLSDVDRRDGDMEDLVAATALNGDRASVRELADRAEELLRCPSVLNSLFRNPKDLDRLYKGLFDLVRNDPASRRVVVASVERGMFRGLESLETDSGGAGASLRFPEAVRFLLLYLQCPLFSDYFHKDDGGDENDQHDAVVFDKRGDLTIALCEAFLSLSYEGYKALVSWIVTHYLDRDVFVDLLVRPLLTRLERGLAHEDAGPVRRVVPSVVAVLRWLHRVSRDHGNIADAGDFHTSAVVSDPHRAFTDLRHWRRADGAERRTRFFLCSHGDFLFSPADKRDLLSIENRAEMFRTAAGEAGSRVAYDAESGTIMLNADPFWTLEIDREHLHAQALERVSKADSRDLRKRLRVVFRGEEGVDAGGVTREFFQLLSARLFDVNSGMWTDRFDGDGDNGGANDVTWFNHECFWNDEGYYLVGVLVGLAVYNDVLLDVHFPPAVYRKLLGLELGLEDMVDPRLRKSLEQLLDYDGDDVEDVFCLAFAIEWTDLGTPKTHELVPNGSDVPVTADNREEYVRLYVQWILEESIHPQYDAFERGFMRVMEHSTLDFLSADELALLVVGSPVLDTDALEANVTYEGGYDATSPVVRHLWSFVRDASEETKIRFLRFCTGAARAPIGGLGRLPFKVQRNGDDASKLPTAHTCFNTLLLPDYGDDRERTEERLGRAILECEGFGLE